MWAYMYEDEDGDATVALDLDHCSLLNDSEDPNVNDLWASKDIKRGEEILVSYQSFEKEGLWGSLGLGDWEMGRVNVYKKKSIGL